MKTEKQNPGNWHVFNDGHSNLHNTQEIYTGGDLATYRVEYNSDPNMGNAGHVCLDAAMEKETNGKWKYLEQHNLTKGTTFDIQGKAIRVRLCGEGGDDGFAKGTYDRQI